MIRPARDPSSTEASPEEVKKTLRCLFNGQKRRAKKVGCVTVDICRLAFEIQRSFPLLRLSVEILGGYSLKASLRWGFSMSSVFAVFAE